MTIPSDTARQAAERCSPAKEWYATDEDWDDAVAIKQHIIQAAIDAETAALRSENERLERSLANMERRAVAHQKKVIALEEEIRVLHRGIARYSKMAANPNGYGIGSAIDRATLRQMHDECGDTLAVVTKLGKESDNG